MADKAERRQAQQDQQGGIKHVQRSLPKKKAKKYPAYSTHRGVNKQDFHAMRRKSGRMPG
ncbi:hypothetical protein NUKP86_12100 [Klebsiella variicola]|nr:hypothetical protein NUKP86_12100 [Klebsiella variicola]